MRRRDAREDMTGAGVFLSEMKRRGQGRGRYLVKLVRDRIDRLEEPPEAFGFHRLDHEAHVKQLRAKLLEEVGEYLLDPSTGELADVYEAVRCLAAVDLNLYKNPDKALKVIAEHAALKREERGGFEEGIGMFAEWVIRD